MRHPFVKICGITTMDAAAAVAESGAGAIGFVFAPGSPREVSVEVAQSLITELPLSLETVGVFRRQPIEMVLRIAGQVGLTTVQLHGGETDADFDRLHAEGLDTIRAISIDDYLRLTAAGQLRTEDRLLIDAVTPGGGERFDPSRLTGEPPPGSWILAGGLTGQNVAELVRAVHPPGVDVSSGVEARRGVKDPSLIRAFVDAVRAA